MPPTPDQFDEYLVPEERLTGVYTGALREQSALRTVTIGVTDRRLLCLAEDGTFVNVGYDSIAAIQSQPRSTLTYHGNDYRVVLATGAFVAFVSFAASVALASNLLAPVLVLTTVTGVVASEYLRRGENAGELTQARGFTERIETRIEDVLSLQKRLDRLDEPLDGHQLLLAGCWVVAAGSFVGAALVASALFAVLAVASTLGGLALCDYALRHREELDGIDLRRRQQREVRISTDDGCTVQIESEPADAIDRELSRLAFVTDREHPAPVRVTS